ncbi:MucBP domain-containing protein [Vagococcus fluvialis]|uniref:MucBP domain-containing protein n=1 Tax=Vagococcus fluvialis TaxID=2738 RepID=UPI003B590FEC
MKKIKNCFGVFLLLASSMTPLTSVFGEEISVNNTEYSQKQNETEETQVTEEIESTSTEEIQVIEQTKNTSTEETENTSNSFENESIDKESNNNKEPQDSASDSLSKDSNKTNADKNINSKIIIPDLTIRRAINKALGHIDDWQTYTPTLDELSKIKGRFELNPGVGAVKVDSLEGLQYLTGISQLITSNVQFLNPDELYKISTLKQLTYLSMGGSNIENIDFVVGLDNLTGLVLPSNKVKDVSPSFNFYNSNKRAQYNFLTQNVSENISIKASESLIIPEMKLTGVNGNQVDFQSFKSNSAKFTYSNGEFIGVNIKPGNYVISYYFMDNSIKHAGAFSGIATLNIEVTAAEAAPVTVKHQDAEGNKLSEDVVLKGKVGLPYQSEAVSINGWTLKETPVNAAGTFTEEAQEIIYVYERTEASPVTVKHQDAEGNKLSEDVVLNGKIGLPYQSEAASITGWALKETPANATGTFTEETQEVIYVYERTEASPVTVKHQDAEGNKLSEDVVLKGKVGLPYQSEAVSINGWTLKETPANAAGTFTEEAQAVIYVYERTEASPVTVKHQDAEGNKLSEDVVLNGKIGLPYQSEAVSINGWTLKETPVNAAGTFTEETQEVIYVYERTEASPVTVKHQDAEGNKLSEDVVLNGKIGSKYVAQAKEIYGYTLEQASSEITGKFTDREQVIVFVYKLVNVNAVNLNLNNFNNKKYSHLPRTGQIQESVIWVIMGILVIFILVVIIYRVRKQKRESKNK